MKKNIKINVISIIIALINIIPIIGTCFIFRNPEIIVAPAILVAIEIILNRIARVMEIKQNNKKRKMIIIVMALIILAYIIYLIVTMKGIMLLDEFGRDEYVLEICIAIVIAVWTIIRKQKETIEQKVNIIDIEILVSIIIIAIFNICIYIITINEPRGIPPTPDYYTINRRTFNSNFTQYEGEKQSGSQVRALISTVKASNAQDENHQVELIEPKEIATLKEYKVELEYGEEGYVNKIIITEARNRKNFNYEYEQYIGKDLSASKIRVLISSVKESNSNNEEHQVELIKPEKIDEKKTYEVEVEYGNNKYINKIIITEE